MEIRKMAGWGLILLAVVKVLQAIHLQTMLGESMNTLSAVVISLLFAAGAAFLWLNKVPWRSETR
jgi:hypothetical protein